MNTGNDLTPSDIQQSYFDAESQKYDRALFTPVKGAINRRFNTLHALSRQIDNPKNRILEIGAGSGIFTRCISQLPNRSIISGDLSFQMLTKAKLKCQKKVNFLQLNAKNLPFPDSSFDIIFSFACIHHIKHLDNLFAECSRVLRPKGFLLAMEPNPLFPLNMLIGLFNSYERGMLYSWPGGLVKKASKYSLSCQLIKNGSFFPGKPAIFENIYSKIEPILENIPLIRKLSIFVYYCFSRENQAV